MVSRAGKKTLAPNGQAAPLTSKETKMKREFVHYKSIGFNDVQAAKAAGSTCPQSTGYKLRHDAWVVEQLKVIEQCDAEAKKVTREKVQDIILDAVNIAQLQGEAGDMVRGAAELNKMMGFHSAKEVHHTVSGEVNHKHEQIQLMSEEELLIALDQEQDPHAVLFDDMEALDGDWEEVEE